MALRLRASDIIAMPRVAMERIHRVCYAAQARSREPMKHRVRSAARWLGISCLTFVGCTKLEDPNEWFGPALGGSSGEVMGGNAGVSGDNRAGMAGSHAGMAGSHVSGGMGTGGTHVSAGSG